VKSKKKGHSLSEEPPSLSLTAFIADFANEVKLCTWLQEMSPKELPVIFSAIIEKNMGSLTERSAGKRGVGGKS
jgi:hypothetical protein